MPRVLVDNIMVLLKEVAFFGYSCKFSRSKQKFNGFICHYVDTSSKNYG